MEIKNHRLVGVDYTKAHLVGGTITPEIIVLHDTAGRLDKFNSAQYLLKAKNVSVQLVIERDGTVTQQVPFNKRAGHAGRSVYDGRKGVNNFSIGIEIVNVGRMSFVKSGVAETWFKQKLSIEEYGIKEVTTPEHGHGFWMAYTEEQINAVIEVCEALFDKYKTLKDIQPHWFISPGRKVDTNPLFPLQEVRARVLGREEPMEAAADEAADHVYSPDSMITIQTPSSSLNMRRWPSFNPNVIATIPNGVDVPVLASGLFDGRRWLKVIFDGVEGWVLSKYTSEEKVRT
jgi:N-acetylmuramoyl-L-alanine amidase